MAILKPDMKLKRGDTFSFPIELKDLAGNPLNLAVGNIQSQVRTNNGALVDTLVITTTGTVGTYNITSLNTLNYPVAILEIDVKIKDGATIFSTETIYLQVIKEVTKWVV